MAIRYVCGATTAAMFAFVTAGFAQTSTPATPGSNATPPVVETQSTPGSDTSRQSGSTAPTQAASQASQSETAITLVGCLMREADYRRAHQSGRGGPAGTGVGLGNEFVLVDASQAPAGATTDRGSSASTGNDGSAAASAGTAGTCSESGTGQAYELTGSHEGDLASAVGQRVEITGMLKRQEVGTSGRTSSGFDPLGQDLNLPEVNVTSYQQARANPAPAPAAAPPPAPPAPAAPVAAPPPSSPAPEPAPSRSTTGTSSQPLPRTASPLPLVGLLGLLSFAAAFGVRTFRTRHR